MAKVLLVVAEFRDDVVSDIIKEMIKVADNTLDFSGFRYDVCRVLSVLEIPSAMSFAIVGDKSKYYGYVALGCIIKGKTDHYERVSRECMRGIMDISIQHTVPIGNGVVTAGNLEDIKYRSQRDGSAVNVALGAAKAVISMISVQGGL